jgi:prepilin-type N-terminal cleavage/methylation domain-containing protein
MRKRGFTLLELTFVISIIAILASILFPLFARARETARRSQCASNLMQIGTALNMYAQSYDGHFPRKDNEFGPLYQCAQDIDVFYCPSDSAERLWRFKTVKSGPGAAPWDSERKVAVETYSSYVYKGGHTNDDRADTPIAGESVAFHGDVVNVLYLGGYVKGVPADVYVPVVKQTHKPVTNVRPDKGDVMP